jgi:hypothetical protein
MRTWAFGRNSDMFESVWKMIAPVFVTVALLVSILLVVFAASWLIEFHL